jgi:hypothetical protein
MPDTHEQSRERRGRRALARQGYALHKSRRRAPIGGPVNGDDLGGYMIVSERNWIAAGSRFDLDLDDVERWIADG